MALAQTRQIRWPVLFIAKNNMFFHVAINDAESMQHTLADIQKWVGGLTEVDIFDSNRRTLVLVTDKAGVSVAPDPAKKRESEGVLVRRLNAVVALLKKAAETSTELSEKAAKSLPLTVRGYAAYLAQVSSALQNAAAEHDVDVRLTNEGPVLAATAAAVHSTTTELSVTADDNPVPNTRGLFHNFWHQVWD